MTDELTVKNQIQNQKVQQEEIASGQVLDELPPEVSKIIERLPPEDSKRISSFLMMMGNFQSNPMSPLIKKLTPEHLTQIITSTDQNDQRQYRFALWSKFYFTLYVAAAIIVFVFLTIYLSKDEADLYKSIIEILVALGGGFGLGVGYEKSKKQGQLN